MAHRDDDPRAAKIKDSRNWEPITVAHRLSHDHFK
jgi:hypothetical protein